MLEVIPFRTKVMWRQLLVSTIGLVGCGWGHCVFRPADYEAHSKVVKLTVDSPEVRAIIDRETERQLSARSNQAEMTFISRVRAFRTIEVPVGTQGKIIEGTNCFCQVPPQSTGLNSTGTMIKGKKRGTA